EAYIDPEFTLRYAEDLSEEYEGFVEYIADETDMGIDIVIAPDSPAKSFRFLKLEYLSSDDSGNIEFDVEELFSVDELLPEKPFMVRMTMFGTIPGYGFSYLGADGLEKRFAISESGFDGSIILIEFN
ncbi:MAG TPA: hypothetical protein PL035_05540, partial [Bacillota bacterium]|nr:hypothetical protein [Bacillota bacterium]